MTTLEEKIKAILAEGKNPFASKDDKKGAEDDGDADDKKGASDKDDSDDSDDSDEDKDADDSDKDEGDTDLSKDSKKKDKTEVKEGIVPGTDAILGTKQKENLTAASPELSGSEKTNKLTKGYNKGTKQPTVTDPAKADSADATAKGETDKIKAGYKDKSAMPKLKAEAIAALFDGETLTEEFKLKAEAIFEAAVEQVAEARIQELQEEYQQQLTEAVEEVKGELVEQIDGYLDHVIEEWLQDNAVALESGIKVEMVSSFMESLKNVFEEHYIEVPEDRLDVVETQAGQIEKLETELAEAKEEAERASSEAQILKCEAIIAEHSKGLTAIESEKMISLAENIEFETEEEFSSKVAALKVSYFRKVKIDENKDDKSQVVDGAQIIETKTHSDVDAVLKVLRKPGEIKLIRSSN